MSLILNYIWSFIKSYWRESLIAVLMGIVYWQYRQELPILPPVTITETKTVYVDRVVTKEVLIDKHSITTVTKPDGTKIVKDTTTATKSDTKSAEKIEQETATVTAVPTADPYRYSATAVINPKVLSDFAVDIGARLGNLPIQGVIGYDHGTNSFHLGVRADF